MANQSSNDSVTITLAQSECIKKIVIELDKMDMWDREKAALLMVLAARYLNKLDYTKKDSAKMMSMAMDHALAAPYL